MVIFRQCWSPLEEKLCIEKYSNLKAYIFVKFSLLNNRLQFNTSYLKINKIDLIT